MAERNSCEPGDVRPDDAAAPAVKTAKGESLDSKGRRAEDVEEESQALIRIVANGIGGGLSVDEFFDKIWQQQCCLFRATAIPVTAMTMTADPAVTGQVGEISTVEHLNPPPLTRAAESGSMDVEEVETGSSIDPYSDLIQRGWEVLVELLEAAGANEARGEEQQEYTDDEDIDDRNDLASCHPLLFQDQVLLDADVAAIQYRHNLFAAYLNGCSVVVNHSDCLVGSIAALCDDLQLSFPHAYANVYVTPPGLQAVNAHADDRDVLVIQVFGEKHWTVYKRLPVPYPYPDEQAGKSFPVPSEVFQGGELLDCTLRPGDVLYMPRGYVHEARCSPEHLSFHVTVALATHDWTLAGVTSDLVARSLRQQVNFRPALPRNVGRIPLEQWHPDLRKQVEDDLRRATDLLLRDVLTVSNIHEALRRKYEHHNRRVFKCRHKVGTNPWSAARRASALPEVTLEVPLRCATPEERTNAAALAQARAAASSSSRRSGPPGLQVREAIHDLIVRLLTDYRQHPQRHRSVREAAYRLGVGRDDGVCDLALLAFARLCVEQGALVVVASNEP